MSKLDNALLRIGLAFWAFFGFLIAKALGRDVAGERFLQ
jgi:hypothetical protein